MVEFSLEIDPFRVIICLILNKIKHMLDFDHWLNGAPELSRKYKIIKNF